MCLGTTERPAPRQVSWHLGPCPWSAPSPVFASGEECEVGSNEPPCAGPRGAAQRGRVQWAAVLAWRATCGGCHHCQCDRAGRNAATPHRRCARHGAPQCSQPQATADLPGARALSPLLRCGGGRALGSGSCGLPPLGLRVRVRRVRHLRPTVERSSLWQRSALASSLLELPREAHDRTEPALHELLADARWHEGPAVNRAACRETSRTRGATALGPGNHWR